MAEELVIRISADVDQAKAGLNSVAESSEKTAQAVLKIPSATDKATAGLNAIGTSANKVPTAINNVSAATTKFTTSVSRVAPATNSANLALINTGRIFQDLPFGILGVTNNINPLVESFQRLVKETGSTGGALKALLSGLSGAGGLGVAVSVITGALTFLTVGLSAFTRGLSSNKEQVDKNKEAFDRLAEAARDSANRIDELSSSIQFLNALGAINIKITGLPQLLDVQAQAIEAQQKIVSLTDEVVKATDRLTEAQRLNTDGTEAQVKAEKDAADNLIDIQKKLTDARRAATLAQRQVTLQRVEDAKKANEKQLSDSQDFINKIISQGKRIQSEFPALVPGDFKIFDLEDLKSQFEKAKDIIADFQRGFGTQQELRLRLIPKITIDKPGFGEITIPEIEIPEAKLRILNPEFDVQDFNKRLRDALHRQISPEQFARDVKDLFGRFQQILPFKLIVDLETAILNGDEAKRKTILAIADLNQAILDATNFITAGLGEAIGEAFGAALAGGDLNAIFKDFGELVGQQVQELGKLLIKLGIQQQIAISALKSVNPILQIAAGIALVAIGAALKNALGKGIEAREKGGPVEKGKPYIVGEKGYELFIPQQSGTIVSHDKLIQAQSVRENNSIREYFAHRQIAESIKAIETRLTNVVYKISEQSDRTNKALVERFTTHSEAINKFVQTSITATNEKTIYAIKYFTTKDKSTKELSDSYIKLISDKVSNVYKDFYGIVRDKERQTTIDRGGETIISSDELKKIISNNQFEKTISSTFSDFVEKVATKTDKLTEAFSNNYKEFYSSVTNQLKEFHYKTSNEKKFNDSNVFESILKNTKESYSSKFESLIERFTNNSEKQTITSRLETITSTLKSFTDKLKISVTNNIFNTSSERLSIEKLHTMFKIPKFEFGGLAFGPTLGILGEGFGISRSNPEVVAPLNQLKGILGGEFGLNISIDGQMRLSNNDLLLQVNRAMKTTLRTTGRTGL